MTVAYPSLLAEEDEFETLILEEPPSLIAVPAWPPTPQNHSEPNTEATTEATPPRLPLAMPPPAIPPVSPVRVVEAFPAVVTDPVSPALFARRAPHEMSPFGTPAQRLLSSPRALLTACAFLGISALWAGWSLARFF